jgi:hypothetical protein
VAAVLQTLTSLCTCSTADQLGRIGEVWPAGHTEHGAAEDIPEAALIAGELYACKRHVASQT